MDPGLAGNWGASDSVRHVFLLAAERVLGDEPARLSMGLFDEPLERTLLAAEYRCALAHAVAHLDLGHQVAMDRRAETRAETREEIAADDLAAERLMPLWRFADVGAWSMSPQEAAAEMDVTEALLLIRWDGLGPAELDHVRGRVAAREDAA